MTRKNTEETKVFFETADAVKLCGILNHSTSNSESIVVLCHGLGYDKNEKVNFVKLAKRLIDDGFDVFRFDFRGHGEGGGSSVDVTVEKETLDIAAVISFLKKIGYKKFAILANSFSAAAAIFYSVHHQDSVMTLIFWNPLIDYHSILKPELPWAKKYFSESAIKNLYKKGFLEVGRRKFKIGIELYKEMKRTYPWKTLLKLRIPILFIHGTKDQIVPYEDSKKYSSMHKSATLETIEGADHGFHEIHYFEFASKMTLNWIELWLK